MSLKTIKDYIISVKDQVRARTADSIIEIIAHQLERVDIAQAKINDEGIVVRDIKGSVIPHPAIKIEMEAAKMAADLLLKHR